VLARTGDGNALAPFPIGKALWWRVCNSLHLHGVAKAGFHLARDVI
jgi:hypothetical protein